MTSLRGIFSKRVELIRKMSKKNEKSCVSHLLHEVHWSAVASFHSFFNVTAYRARTIVRETFLPEDRSDIDFLSLPVHPACTPSLLHFRCFFAILIPAERNRVTCCVRCIVAARCTDDSKCWLEKYNDVPQC